MDAFSAKRTADEGIELRSDRTALLVVDMVRDFCDPDGAMALPGSERLYPIQNAMLTTARAQGAVIGWIADRHRPGSRREREFVKRVPHCLEGTPGAEIVPQLQREADEFLFVKRRYSAFFGTDLDITLRDNLIDTLVIFGVVTNICVRSTVHDAFFNGYQVVVPHDACAATGPREQASSLYDIATHFGIVSDSTNVISAMEKGHFIANMPEFETTTN
ncbi:cysteine hydrolase [Roseovarius sp. TE539]|uniref:cysteine hydrolase family protein n=1 Tax=Roseovarius sp. TE539 TaxID=2249812 RepID=UPI000DE17124|nr:isochorismatase family cysteine hydrolase [Roseovarius sp. TE539]RBI68394.1 cysteine hydrolase [Roseovarius sp. TE539]